MSYRLKKKNIEAIKFDGHNLINVIDFLQKHKILFKAETDAYNVPSVSLAVSTGKKFKSDSLDRVEESMYIVIRGDYVYLYSDEDFNETYEIEEETTNDIQS